MVKKHIAWNVSILAVDTYMEPMVQMYSRDGALGVKKVKKELCFNED